MQYVEVGVSNIAWVVSLMCPVISLFVSQNKHFHYYEFKAAQGKLRAILLFVMQFSTDKWGF